MILSQINKKFIAALAIYTLAVALFDFSVPNVAPDYSTNQSTSQSISQNMGRLRTLDVRTSEEQATQKSGKEVIENFFQGQNIQISRGDILKGKELTLQATAYCWTGFRTATGPWPRQGVTIAVNPQIIPFHSKVFIEGVGWRVAEDRIPPESIRKGASIDIYMGRREKDAWDWGRRDVKIIIIPPREDLKNN